MKVKIFHLIKGAKRAKGLVVVIDVFRAFSTACYVFNNGAEKIISVGDTEIAYNLKKENADFVLIGERGAKRLPGFDYGNSPTEIENVDFCGRTIIHTTSAGTQGMVGAINANEIITGSFVNAQAIIDYIKKQNPEEVSLVAMGTDGKRSSDEDELCAEYIKNSLEDKKCNFAEIVARLRNCESAYKFFDSAQDWAPERDFDLCLSLNKFNFILRTEHRSERKVFLKKVVVV